jgi:hypothetical protein
MKQGMENGKIAEKSAVMITLVISSPFLFLANYPSAGEHQIF